MENTPIWTYDQIREYVYSLAEQHGLVEQITESLVLRVATLAQTTFDVALFMVFEDADPETEAVVDFAQDIQLLISNYIQNLFVIMRRHKDLKAYQNVQTDG